MNPGTASSRAPRSVQGWRGRARVNAAKGGYGRQGLQRHGPGCDARPPRRFRMGSRCRGHLASAVVPGRRPSDCHARPSNLLHHRRGRPDRPLGIPSVRPSARTIDVSRTSGDGWQGGFYVRVPRPREIRFRDTLLLAVGPFAIDLFVMSEILYLFGPAEVQDLRFGLIAFPILLLLAGLLTSLVPGASLLDALDVRVVNPPRDEVVRAAEFFERILGPLVAAPLL